MLIKFDYIVGKYGKPKGIIHIGAHMLEEKKDYDKHGLTHTIWLEANPQICDKAKHKLSDSEKLFNYAVSDKDGDSLTLNVTNNGQSSSILELDVHKKYYPQIVVVDKVEVQSVRMDTLMERENIDISNYDFINLDIQGAELLALKGFGDLLNNINYIYIEVNFNTLYKDCPLVEEIDGYLSQYGFKRVETKNTFAEWGDAIYIKR